MVVKRRVTSILVHAALLLFLLLCIFPLVWMISTSFKLPNEVSFLSIVPKHVTLTNYEKVINNYPFYRFFANSFLVAAGSTAVAMLFGTMGGFALARMSAPGTELIFVLLLFTIMVPVQVRLVPLFMVINRMGLSNSLVALAIPHVASPISIFLSRQYFKTIPRDLDEAAIIDGCSWWGIYSRIIMPLSKPMLSALTIIKFMGAWNDFLWPLMVSKNVNTYTLTVGLAMLKQQHRIDWGLNMAGATLASLPVLIVFLIFQRHFVAGIAMSGMKN